LILATGTLVQKYFLVPFFSLQAPSTAISWINQGTVNHPKRETFHLYFDFTNTFSKNTIYCVLLDFL
jgi:hypothetical protein